MLSHKVIIHKRNLKCLYCETSFSSTTNKSKHIAMNRCPVFKQMVNQGQILPYEPRQKKAKTKESSIIYSNPEPEPELENYLQV
jgi:hypothetical protein